MTTVIVLIISALIVGFSKSAISGMGLMSAVLFATVLPARESTASVLLLLLVGDAYATWAFRKHVHWRTLVTLAPAVVPGVIGGAWFLANVDDAGMRHAIGIIVLVMVVFHVILQRVRSADAKSFEHLPKPVAWVFGLAAGFTSMVANAGGPIMTVYLLNMPISVMEFIGTNAWFFALLNLFKLPFSIGLGLIHGEAVLRLVWLAPLVLVGAYGGKRLVPHIDRDLFSKLVLGTSVLASLNLLLR